MLRIALSSDVHLGYGQKHPEKANDSYEALEEILAEAAARRVDFVLLGGDLFHENKPSRAALHRSMELLRAYSLGDAPVEFDVVSDGARTFPAPVSQANFKDPNLNVALPVFSIHGNHDEPASDGTLGEENRQLAALDLLSVAGLINYFGCVSEVDRPEIFPVLIRKGPIRLAIYGIGAVRDEKLYQALSLGRVVWNRPDDADRWVHVLVLHQNRAVRTRKHGIPEELLPEWLHLVIWGHEHECLPVPAQSSRGFRILQPGSPTITSLCPAEAVPKHMFLLSLAPDEPVGPDSIRIEPIELRRVRPLEFEDVALADAKLAATAPEAVEAYLASRVDILLNRARKRACAGKKPLLRLRVENSGYEQVCPTPSAFGAKFKAQVANPEDLLMLYRHQDRISRRGGVRPFGEYLEEVFERHDDGGTRLREILRSTVASRSLDAVPPARFHRALEVYVDKEEDDALQRMLRNVLAEVQTYLRDEQHVPCSHDESELRMRAAEYCSKRKANVHGEEADPVPPVVSPRSQASASKKSKPSSSSPQVNRTDRSPLPDRRPVEPLASMATDVKPDPEPRIPPVGGRGKSSRRNSTSPFTHRPK